MACLIALVLVAVVSIQARTFNNPILSNKPYYGAGAIKVNGTYYVVASLIPNLNLEVLPVHTSTDLIEWKPAGYAFDGSDTPAWARNTSFFSPEIHQAGLNFLMYFEANDLTSTFAHIGVATSLHPLGPYISTDRPILSLAGKSSWIPSLINDEGKLYLMWTDNSYAINAQQLYGNGLSFSSDQSTTLLKPSLPWEGIFIFTPSYVRRGTYHYLLYNSYCSGIGVARSTNALGPYEKFSKPIIVPKGNYTCVKEASVIKDLDGNNDVIFFTGALSGSWVTSLASLSWGSDDWPFVEQY